MWRCRGRQESRTHRYPQSEFAIMITRIFQQCTHENTRSCTLTHTYKQGVCMRVCIYAYTRLPTRQPTNQPKRTNTRKHTGKHSNMEQTTTGTQNHTQSQTLWFVHTGGLHTIVFDIRKTPSFFSL